MIGHNDLNEDKEIIFQHKKYKALRRATVTITAIIFNGFILSCRNRSENTSNYAIANKPNIIFILIDDQRWDACV